LTSPSPTEPVRSAADPAGGGCCDRTLFSGLLLPDTTPARRKALRDEIVRRHLPLVRQLAQRFRNRGEAYDDLVQVGTIGLLHAVDRFDPGRGVDFGAFATPTIVGEIKRHFRDRGWAIRVPRRLQENALAVSRASTALYQEAGRSPTVDEIARHTGLSEEDVLEALESVHAYTTLSLDAEVDPTGAAMVVSEEPELSGAEARAALFPLLDRLPPRERRIVVLRFFAGLTQSEIAGEVGISQMHVSRLLARILATLRHELGEPL
jgi:RNA polymerase sigma-B factor